MQRKETKSEDMYQGHQHRIRSGGEIRLGQYEITSVKTVPRATARVMRAAILEIRMHAGLLCRESVGWVVLEQGLQQVATSLIKCRDQSRVGALPLGEGCFVVRKGGDAGPCVFVGGTEDTGIKYQQTGRALERLLLTGKS